MSTPCPPSPFSFKKCHVVVRCIVCFAGVSCVPSKPLSAGFELGVSYPPTAAVTTVP